MEITTARVRRAALALALGGAVALTCDAVLAGLPHEGPGSPAPGPPAATARPSSPAAAPAPSSPLIPPPRTGGHPPRRHPPPPPRPAPAPPVAAATTASATATHALTRFDLDFAGNTLHKV